MKNRNYIIMSREILNGKEGPYKIEKGSVKLSLDAAIDCLTQAAAKGAQSLHIEGTAILNVDLTLGKLVIGDVSRSAFYSWQIFVHTGKDWVPYSPGKSIK